PFPAVQARPTRLLRAFVAVTALAVPRAAPAHPAPFSYVDLRLQSGVIEGTVVAHIFDVAHDLNIANSERLLDPVFAAQQSRAFAALTAPRLTLTVDGRVVDPLQWSEVEVIPDRQSIRIHVRYRIAGPPGV